MEDGGDNCQESDVTSETGSPVHKQVNEVLTTTLIVDNNDMSDEESLQNKSVSLSDMSVSCTSSPVPEIEVNVSYVMSKGPSSNDNVPAICTEEINAEKGHSDVCTSGEVKSPLGLKMSGESIPCVDICTVAEKENKDALTSIQASGSVDQTQTTCEGESICKVEDDKSDEGLNIGILDDSRTIQDNLSLSESFLVPSDPLATFLDLSNGEGRVSSPTPVKPQDKAGSATLTGETIRNDKVLSILFGTAMKSPVGVAFKCSASQEEFHVSEDDNIHSSMKKQILEERFFQRQKCLETTFKISEIIGGLQSPSEDSLSSDGHQSSKTHGDGKEGEGAELLCNTISATIGAQVMYGEGTTFVSTGAPICDNPTRSDQVPPECQGKVAQHLIDNNVNLDCRRSTPQKVGLNLFEKAVECQSHFFIHKAEKDNISRVQIEEETDDRCSRPLSEIVKGNKHSKETSVDNKDKQGGGVGHSEATTVSGRDNKQNELSNEFRNLTCSSKGPMVVAGGSIGELILPLRKPQLDLCKKEPESEVVQDGGVKGECSVLPCKRKKTVLNRGDAENEDNSASSLSAQISTDCHDKKSCDCETLDMEDRDSKGTVDDDDKTVIYEGDEGEEDELNISTPEIMKMLDEELAGHQKDPCEARQGSPQKENDEGELQGVLEGENDGDCVSRMDQPTKLKAAKWQRKSFLTLNSLEVEKVSSTSEEEFASTIAEKEIKTSDCADEHKQECKDLAGKRMQEILELKTRSVDGNIAADERALPLMGTSSPSEIAKVNSCNTNVHQEYQEGEIVQGAGKEKHQASLTTQSLSSGITLAQQESNLKYSCSPGARSSPGGPSTRTELNSLVSGLRSEIKRKLKEHTQKVVKGLIKMKGLKYGQDSTNLDGSVVCWREVIQIKKERRKKMKLKRMKYRSKGQLKGQPRTTKSLVALQCLNDLASKLSKCSIDHKVGGKVEWVSSPVKSKEMSPLKKHSPLTGSTKPKCGVSPRTLPFKKDFTASMGQQNVFGAFSPKSDGQQGNVNLSPLSSPWRLTLVKIGNDSKGYQIEKAKASNILKEATFIPLSKDNKENEWEFTKKTDLDIKKTTTTSGYSKTSEGPVLTSTPSVGELKSSLLQAENNVSSKQVPSPPLAQQNLPLMFDRQINMTSNMHQWLGFNPPFCVPRHPLFLQTYWTLPYVRPSVVPTMNYQMIPPNPILSLQNQVASLACAQQYSLPVQEAAVPCECKPSNKLHSQTVSHKQDNLECQSSAGTPAVGPGIIASQNAAWDAADSTNVTHKGINRHVERDIKPIASCPPNPSGCQRDLRNIGRVDKGNQLDNSHLPCELSTFVADSSSSENHCVIASSHHQGQSHNEEIEPYSSLLEEGQKKLSKCAPEDIIKESGPQGKCEIVAMEIIDDTSLGGSEEVSHVDINSEVWDIASKKDASVTCEKEDDLPDSVSSKMSEVTSEIKEDVIYVSSDDATGTDTVIPDYLGIKYYTKLNVSRCDMARKMEVGKKTVNMEERKANFKEKDVVPDDKGAALDENIVKHHRSEVLSHGTAPFVPKIESFERRFETNEDKSVINDDGIVTMDGIHKPDEDVILLQNENAVAPDGIIGIPDGNVAIPDARRFENSDKGVVIDIISLDESEEIKQGDVETGRKKVTAKEETSLSGINDTITDKEIVFDEILEVDEDDEALNDDILLSSGEHSANFERVKNAVDLSVVEDDVLSVGDDVSCNDFMADKDTLESCKSSLIDDFSAHASRAVTKNNLSKDISDQGKSLSCSTKDNVQPNSLLQSSITPELHLVEAQSDQDAVVELNRSKLDLESKKKNGQKESSMNEKSSSSYLKDVKGQQEYDKSERYKAAVKGREDFQVEVKGTRSPEKKPGKVRKLSGEKKAGKIKTVEQDSRTSGKGRVKEVGVRESKRKDERSKKKEKSVSHQKSPVKKSSRVVKFVNAPSPSKDMRSPKKHKTASKRTNSETEEQAEKRMLESSSPTKRTKLSFLPDCKLMGFQIPKLSSKEKEETSKEETPKSDTVMPRPRSSQIATLDPEKKTVKINLKHAVVELNRLKLDLKSKKKSGQKESSKDHRKVNLSKSKESPLLGKIRLKDVKGTRSPKTHSRGRDSAIGKPSKADQRNVSSKIEKVIRDDEKISSSLSQKLSKDLLKRLGKKHQTDKGDCPSSKITSPRKVKSSRERRTVTILKDSKLDQSKGASLDSHKSKHSKLTASHSKSSKSRVEQVKFTPGQANKDFSSDESTPRTPVRKFWRTYESKMSPATKTTSPLGKIGIPTTSEIWRVVDEVFPSPGITQGHPSMKLPQEGNSKGTKADLDKVEVCKENKVKPTCSSSRDGQPIPTICSSQVSSFGYSESEYADVVKQHEFDYPAPINSCEAAQGSSYVLPTKVRHVVTIDSHGNHPPTETSLPSQGSHMVDSVGDTYTASNHGIHDGEVSALTQQQDTSLKSSNVVGQTTPSESHGTWQPIQTIGSSFGMQLSQAKGDSHVATAEAVGLHGRIEAANTRPPTPHPLMSSAGDGSVPVKLQEEKKEKIAVSKEQGISKISASSTSQANSSVQNKTTLKSKPVKLPQSREDSHVAPSESKGLHSYVEADQTRPPTPHPVMSSAGDGSIPVKPQEKKKEKIAMSKEQGNSKVSSSTSQATSSGQTKTSLKSKPVKGDKRFHPYMPHRIKSINLVYCKHLLVPRMEELMWNHTFISPKLKQPFPPTDIFSIHRTDPGRFSSVGQLHHQEKTLKNADEVEPKAVPGMVTDAKKIRVKTLDASLLKMVAATDDIQKLLELDEMVYALKNEAEPSRPLRAHSSVRYHPYH